MAISLRILLVCLPVLVLAQPNDTGYSAKIREYTTEPFFLTELVDHLPASDRVPTPEKVLGYIIGTPNKLTYSADVHRYMREAAKASPRVKVFTQGTSEEGRETILVVVSDEANIDRLDRFKQITARLADPRRLPEADANPLLAEGLPIYWLSGSIHSPETGSPEMLMELVYRLAVEETPFVQAIRRNTVVMITPVLEVDGRDKQVDLYNYRKANPGKPAPNLLYWGKYVAHDNNRDGMALSLNLSRIVMKTFFEYHPQVLHDLHESVPFLYTSTGTGPYNAWLDPIVVNEWQRLAYHEIEELTKRGVPGVWTHGFYDGWAANYMFMAAQAHNSIGRFYETFGGRGADTLERTIPAGSTTRTWFRPNPPLSKVKWSLRNNVNLQQSGVLLALNYTANNKETFLRNFYLKSRRSVEKAAKEGPAAYIFPADDPRPVEVAETLNLLQLHGVEVHRASETFEVAKQKYAAGSYVVRMDQPYSRIGDMLLDKQYYSPSDPRPYDDTGWTFGPLRNVRTIRVTEPNILKAPMTLISEPLRVRGQRKGNGSAGFLIAHNTDNTLATLRFRLKQVRMLAAEEPFKAGDADFPAGSFLIPLEGNPANFGEQVEQAAIGLGLTAHAIAEMPKVATHAVAAPRIALVHTWQNTQNEGWYRIAFDRLQIPYDYISDHVIRDSADLRSRWDVIIFGPVGGSAQNIVNGIPVRGDPIPWKKSAITPNLGTSPDQTDDIRGGMGLRGLMNIEKFVEAGGLFVTIAGNASIPIDYGLISGISIMPARDLQARGSVIQAEFSDRNSPIAYGYGDKLAIYFNQSPVFQVSQRGGFGPPPDPGPQQRTSGRGSASDPDVPQARPFTPPPPEPQVRPGEEPPLSDDMREFLRPFLPPPEMQPRVVLRFAAQEKDLLVSGLLAGGRELAGRPAVIDVPKGSGHVLLFANNPIWRQQTQGSFFLLFNAILHYDNLGAGRNRSASTTTSSGAQ